MTALPADITQIKMLCTKYSVSSLSVFGSYARGEARTDSDIDLLVSFSKRVSFLRMVALERELAHLLGTIPETLSRILAKMIKQELIKADGPHINISDREGLMEIAEGLRRL